ncbi:MAG: flippase-like domain-containing protein [Planctomycetales bacterium]|nr:flippase-like domain-containing protein [Planctomycetales bacterium]
MEWESRLSRIAITLIKVVVPAVLFGYLLLQVPKSDYDLFWGQSKRWELLVSAQVVALAAIIFSFLRWRHLVLAFGIPFERSEALRLGFLGYLLNFVSFGSVGGDLFKAILVAKGKPGWRTEAVASVLLDRAIGLLGLVILAWLSLVFSQISELPTILVGIRRGAGVLACVSILALVVAVFSGSWLEKWIDWMETLPLAGQSLARMARAVRRLRTQPLVLINLLVTAILIHALLASSVFLISAGVYPAYPSFVEHLMVVPPAMAAGALPLAPGGIGYQEGALAGLFRLLPDLPVGFSGILVATIYRLITLFVAGIGLFFYWLSHGREFKLVNELSQNEDSRSN